MRRLLRTAGWIALTALILAALAVGTAVFLVRRPAFQRWCGARLAAQLGPNVHLKAVDISFWPIPGVRLTDVTVTLSSGAKVLAAPSVRCAIQPNALLSGRLVLTTLLVERPHLTLERTGDGGFPIRTLFERPTPSGAERSSTVLPHIAVRDGELTFIDHAVSPAPLNLRLEHLNADAVGLATGSVGRIDLDAFVRDGGSVGLHGTVALPAERSADGPAVDLRVKAEALDLAIVSRYVPSSVVPASIEGTANLDTKLAGKVPATLNGEATVDLPSGSLQWAGFQVDAPITLASRFAFRRGALRLSEARLQVTRATSAAFTGDQVQASFSYAARKLRVKDLRFHALGGAWMQTGTLSFDETPQMTTEIHADDVTLNDTLRLLAGTEPQPGTHGTLRLIASLSGPFTGPLRGTATVQTSSDTIGWPDVEIDGPAELTTQVVSDEDAVALSAASLQAARLRVAKFVAETVRAGFDYANRQLRVSNLSFDAFSGTWNQSGTVWLASTVPFDVTVEADNVACRELLKALADEETDAGFEVCQIEGQVHGQLTGGSSWLHTLTGRGGLLLRDGTLPSSSIITAIWDKLVPRLHPLHIVKRLQQPTTLDRMAMRFTLRDAQVSTTDLSLVTSDYRLTGQGIAGLDGSLDFTTQVALTATGIQKLIVMTSLPLPAVGSQSLPPIPTRITGTLADPTVVPEVSQLPLQTLRWVFYGVRGTAKAIEKAIGTGVETLDKGLKKVLPRGRRHRQTATPVPQP